MNMENNDAFESWEDDAEAPEVPPGPEVTPELFLAWRSPRRGVANPQRMDNPVWEWLIESSYDAYAANKMFHGPSSVKAGPCWCFDRFGQSSTLLPDGRTVYIAGEHEDHYDPDFYIYNDVVVQSADGRIEIRGYPTDVFPPTDSHTATLVGERIVIIGNLGYPQERQPGNTPVYLLDLGTFGISKVAACGSPPGWIHDHQAELSEDGTSILIRQGQLERGDPRGALVENIDDWRLHLDGWRWERLTARSWLRWEFFPKERKRACLWEIRQAAWERSVRWKKEFASSMAKLAQELGVAPDLDLFARLYRPDVAHELLPEEEESHNVRRIRINGVIVRYVEDSHGIQMTVEGDLPTPVTDALVTDLTGKLAALENTPYGVRPL